MANLKDTLRQLNKDRKAGTTIKDAKTQRRQADHLAVGPFKEPWIFKAYHPGDDQPRNYIGDIDFTLTDESIELFEQGKPGQGYVGLAELDTGKVHLIPTFNCPNYSRIVSGLPVAHKSEEARRLFSIEYFADPKNTENKYGKPFSCHTPAGKLRENVCVTTEQPSGKNTGVAHGNVVALTGVSHKAHEKGLVIGFGVWKGSDYLLREFRDRSSSQNNYAIAFGPEFLDDYLDKNSPKYDPKLVGRVDLQRARSLPQELGDKLLGSLLEQLPCDPSQKRDLSVDGRARNLPNPFHEAAREGDLEKVIELIDRGMNVNEIAMDKEETVLITAAAYQQLDVAAYLLEHTDIDLQFKDKDGFTFYDMLAYEKENLDTLLYLIEDDQASKSYLKLAQVYKFDPKMHDWAPDLIWEGFLDCDKAHKKDVIIHIKDNLEAFSKEPSLQKNALFNSFAMLLSGDNKLLSEQQVETLNQLDDYTLSWLMGHLIHNGEFEKFASIIQSGKLKCLDNFSNTIMLDNLYLLNTRSGFLGKKERDFTRQSRNLLMSKLSSQMKDLTDSIYKFDLELMEVHETLLGIRETAEPSELAYYENIKSNLKQKRKEFKEKLALLDHALVKQDQTLSAIYNQATSRYQEVDNTWKDIRHAILELKEDELSESRVKGPAPPPLPPSRNPKNK